MTVAIQNQLTLKDADALSTCTELAMTISDNTTVEYYGTGDG